MKFADKLFFVITALLTLSFAVFGMWLMSAYFQRILNREIAQGDTQSQMFQYLFEMAYQSGKDLGDEYAILKAAESVAGSVEKEGTGCFVLDGDGEFYYVGKALREVDYYRGEIEELTSFLKEDQNYVYGIRNTGDYPHLYYISVANAGDHKIYLGVCNDLTTIYEDRKSLLNQYRLAAILLIFAGGICIYFLARYITEPIVSLKNVAGRIAKGNYELRSRNKSKDEIGELAGSFNSMTDRLVEQMHEKELEARQKEDFTAAFAHELKTPLTSIIGYADMLNSVEMTEEERSEAYFYIYSQGKRLENLSHKLLELVSMEKNEPVMKRINAKELEENLRTTMRPIFESRKIKGRINLEKGHFMGDQDLILSLLYNLLDNAVKAVEADGFILLKGNVLAGGYEIKVVDNGRGIPQEEISRITEAFYMVDKSRSRKEGGAGIGMALCRRIIELHGGALQIESKLGEGTVMRLLFPGERRRGVYGDEDFVSGGEETGSAR